jgi:hypothetical protein
VDGEVGDTIDVAVVDQGLVACLVTMMMMNMMNVNRGVTDCCDL